MNHKIVFAGSVGAGKTTSIQSISDVQTFSTEEAATDEVRLMKETTTVAMDYGQMHLENGTKVHLYGAPGQGRFDFMWEILAKGAIGVVILVDDASADPLDEVAAYLDAFTKYLPTDAMVVGVTRKDLWRGPSLQEYRKVVAKHDASIPVFTLDAREKLQVASLLKVLLYRIDPWIH